MAGSAGLPLILLSLFLKLTGFSGTHEEVFRVALISF